ncbi:MAG TPA: hypothetical protein VFF13_07045 [archaeon]|nr:hypothetical protein [archaeon]
MINPKVLLFAFFGKKPIGIFVSEKLSLKDAVMTYAIVFLIVKLLLVLEIIVFVGLSSFLAGQALVDLLVGMLLLLIGLLVLIPFVFAAELVFIYLLGALQFMIAGFYRKDKGSLNNFNASFIALASSIKLVVGLFLLVPFVGWFAAVVALIYGVVLMYRFIRDRFTLNDAQAAIVVLIPTDLLLAILLVFAGIISTFLIGTTLLF